jgi:D-glycero-D-manno-heptose 1,7-bisphosphate phosphatase
VKAIFLDRDGVLIAERNGAYNFELENSVLLPGVGEFLQKMKLRGYCFVVITNQSGVAQGLYSVPDVEAMHQSISNQLAIFGVEILEYYACPHHPTSSLCICRKPLCLLVEKSLARFHIRASESFFVGDRPRDMEAATAAGVTGILIESNQNLNTLEDFFN